MFNKLKKSIPMNDDELIDALEKTAESKTFAAKRLAKWFSVDVTIKIFGHIIWEYHFPPQEK